jgi:hypothetical protein
MRYTCPYCDGKHWFYSTMVICKTRWEELKSRALSS